MRDAFFWPDKANPTYSATGRGRALTCVECKLHRKCKSPKMKMSGKGRKKILIIPEAPGEEEDLRGTQLVGRVGKFTRQVLDDMDLDLDRDFWKINAVNCRPTDKKGENRPPTGLEINACRPRVWQAIKEVKPKIIIPMGSAGITSLFGHRMNKVGKVTRWVGWHIPDQISGAWVCPTYHPSFVMRNERKTGNAAETLFRNHIEAALGLHRQRLPEPMNERDKVKILSSRQAVSDFLDKVLKKQPPWLAVDFETTAVKPHAKGQKIVTCSMCFSRKRAYAWQMKHCDRGRLKNVLRHKRIKKIASNMPFEQSWAIVFLGYTIRPWGWDTMLGSHVHDNRKNITSIKFQALVRYGIIGYDSVVEKFLKSPKKAGCNAFNKIHKAPKNELLIYNGLDSLLEFWTAMDQMQELEEAA